VLARRVRQHVSVGGSGFTGWTHLTGERPQQLVRIARNREAELGLEAASTDERAVVNMLRHEYTNYDGRVSGTRSDRLYAEVLDAIALDFPWLAAQCARDKARHPQGVPQWVQHKRLVHHESLARQRRARQAAQALQVGQTVTIKWRSVTHEGELVEVRRSRVTVRFVGHADGCVRVVDRPADTISPA
jgi:hypothetical protein